MDPMFGLISRGFLDAEVVFGRRGRSNLVSYDLFYIEVLRFRLDNHLPDLLLLN